MMGDMMDRCMDAMGSMMGGGMMGSGMMLAVLLLVLFVWVIGLAAVGALIFWGVRRLSRTSSANG
jgi:predicted metalloprotease